MEEGRRERSLMGAVLLAVGFVHLFFRAMSETPNLNSPGHGRGAPYRPEVREVVRRQREMSQNPTPEEQVAGFQGWNERGYVPHRDEAGLTQFVTFRLCDSFPAEPRDEWERLLKIEDSRERRTQLETWLDQGHGLCHLRDPRCAAIVAESLRKFDGTRYRLMAFTIMPNHVHVLLRSGPCRWRRWSAVGSSSPRPR